MRISPPTFSSISARGAIQDSRPALVVNNFHTSLTGALMIASLTTDWSCAHAGPRKRARQHAAEKENARFMTPLICAGSAFDLELEVQAPILTSFALDRPLVVDRVAELQGVERLGKTDAIAHVKARREIASEYQLRLGVAAGFDAHIFEVKAQLLPQLRSE